MRQETSACISLLAFLCPEFFVLLTRTISNGLIIERIRNIIDNNSHYRLSNLR